MDWRALLHNRWALAGLATAGLVGGIVWYRRRATGGGGAASSSSGGTQTSPGYAGGPGTFDSTGTDVAAWLGNYSQNLDAQFAEFKRDILTQLGQVGSNTSGSGGTARNPWTLPAVVPVASLPAGSWVRRARGA